MKSKTWASVKQTGPGRCSDLDNKAVTGEAAFSFRWVSIFSITSGSHPCEVDLKIGLAGVAVVDRIPAYPDILSHTWMVWNPESIRMKIEAKPVIFFQVIL